MKDKDWCRIIEGEIKTLKDRVTKLEKPSNSRCSSDEKVVELEIVWPEADIDDLHFNQQKTKSVFELKEDGNYYSRDILIISARDTDEKTGRDLLSEYLDSEEVKQAFYEAMCETIGACRGIKKVFLPEKEKGIKKYNGVDWWYWLKPRAASSSHNFIDVIISGNVTSNYASAAGGVAPAFCVA